MLRLCQYDIDCVFWRVFAIPSEDFNGCTLAVHHHCISKCWAYSMEICFIFSSEVWYNEAYVWCIFQCFHFVYMILQLHSIVTINVLTMKIYHSCPIYTWNSNIWKQQNVIIFFQYVDTEQHLMDLKSCEISFIIGRFMQNGSRNVHNGSRNVLIFV